ncbi:MAG TPA: sigma-70 family RNA polymerase sigma factor [Planctomycetaceae bacterium]|nr:sigma-70 family RNA polymerase sigma factor [Planctomycetaceae bacterium]
MNRISQELLAKLLDEHGPALVLYARQWCDTPEDVVQEAFISLLQQPRAIDNVVAWLYRVVRNGAVTASRRNMRRRHHETSAAHRGEPWFDCPNGQAMDAQLLIESMEGLPIEQRETVVARLWGGLSWEEVAELTETSTSTAHRRFQAAMSVLRERFPDDD